MYAFDGESWESAMKIPIAIRKWLIKRWNKQKEQEQKDQNNQPGGDTSQPLTPGERMKMIKNAQGVQHSEVKTPFPSDFMGPTRNNP